MAQGYDGLPNYYGQSSDPITPNLGLSLKGMDPIVAENFVLVDAAVGGGGSTVKINSVTVNNPNFNNTTPAAPVSGTNVVWQVDGSGNVSANVQGLFFVDGISTAWGSQNLQSGSGISLVDAGSGNITINASGTPGGGNTDIQFNQAGVFGGDPNFTWDYTNELLTINSQSLAAFINAKSGDTPPGTNFFGMSLNAGSNNSTGSLILGVSRTLIVNAVADSGAGGSSSFSELTAANVNITVGTQGTVTTAQGILILPSIQGTVTTLYGIKIGDCSNGSYGTSRSILTGAGIVEFTDKFLLSGTQIDATDFTKQLAYNLANISTGTTRTLNIPNADSSTAVNTTATAGQALASFDITTGQFTKIAVGTGSVTSVALTMPAIFSVGGSPITTSGTLAVTLATETANTVFAGPTSGGAAAPTFRALVASDIPNSTITPIWNNLQNATGALTLANAGNATTFNQTSAVNWTWANTTAATSSVNQSSPILNLNGTYWTGAASATDSWTIQDSVANGTNGTSTLLFSHSGSTGNATLAVPAGGGVNSGGITFGAAGNGGGITGNGSNVAMYCAASGGSFRMSFAGTEQARLTGNNPGINLNTIQNSAPVILATNQYLTNTSGAAIQFSSTGMNNSGVAGGAGTMVGMSGTFTWAPTSGTTKFIGFNLNPTINQTGTNTGDYTALQVNVVETALTGTNKLLLDLQAGASGGTSEFAINNTGVVTKYAATTTVGQGIASQIANVDLTAQSAAITATNLTASAPRTGMYRIVWSATITTAGTTSTLGGANGFQVLYTSPTDSVVKTTVPGNSVTSAANTTGTAVGGEIIVYAKTGTAIQYQYGYTSSGTAMVYELHIRLEAL